MKHELTLYYSVANCGDGSAYPYFFETEELADWDQENQSEDWGEPCTGSITLESDSPITVKEKIATRESVLLELIDEEDDEKMKRFIEQFYPNKDELPVFRVEQGKKHKEWYWNKIFVGDRLVDETLKYPGESGAVLEEVLNSIRK